MSSQLSFERARLGDHQRGQLVRIAGFVFVAGMLGGVIPLVLLNTVPDVGRSKAWIPTALLIVWSGVRLGARITIGRPELFDFVFWLFVYIFMGLAPTVQIRADEPSSTTPGIDPGLDMRIAGTVWLGVLAYEVGRKLRRRRVHKTLKSPPPQKLDVRVGAAVALACLGLMAALYYVSRIGVGTLFMSRYSSSDVRDDVLPDLATRSVISALSSFPLLIAAGVFIAGWRGRILGPGSFRLLVAAIPTVGVLLVVVNPISSARYDFGTVGFALVIFCGAAATRQRARITMIGVVFAFLFVFPIADAFRSDTVNVQRNGFFGEYLANPDYDAFWQIGNALMFVRDGLVEPFRQFLGVMFFWVPRDVWPNKPADTGTMLADYRGYTFGNLSAPLWAELLVNGGVALLLAGFVTLGAVLRRLDQRIAEGLLSGSPFWSIVGGVFPFYMVILLRGSLLQATGTLVVAVASTLAIRRRPTSAQLRDDVLTASW